MTTLYSLSLRLARMVGDVRSGTADGGTTTTIEDADRAERDGHWDYGTVWINDEVVRITSTFTNGSDINIEELDTAVSADDTYRIATARYSKDWIVDAINQELLTTRVAKTDKSSITVVAEQTEYQLPTDVKDVRQVYHSTSDDSDDMAWERINFEIEPDHSSNSDILIIDQYEADDSIKIVYVAPHGAVSDSDDTILDVVEDLVLYRAAVTLLLKRIEENSGGEALSNRVEYYSQQADREEALSPIRLPLVHGNMMTW